MHVALDLSVKSTGYAFWRPGMDRPRCGIWQLAGGIEWAGRACFRLHRNLIDLHAIEEITSLIWEEPLPHWALQGQTNLKTLRASAGLALHAESFAEAVGAQRHETNQATWRRHFIGRMPRGTKTVDLKRMAMERCRQLGFDPEKHDAAEACGLLDYLLDIDGVVPPWRDASVFSRQFAGAPA